MLPAQRRLEMAQFIQKNGGADTETLARQFGVSMITARRDLKILEEQNQLKTTWGGAVPLNFQPREIPYANKATSELDAKKAIACLAADMVHDDTCILLDAGTTMLELAELLRTRRITVITTDLQIALLLVSSPSVTVHLAGGWVDPVSLACNDENTCEFFNSLHVTQAFIGTSFWDVARGASTSSTAKMHIKRRMMASAQESILLTDSSKYGKFSHWSAGRLHEFGCIVTDSGLPVAVRDEIAATGARLHIAEINGALFQAGHAG